MCYVKLSLCVMESILIIRVILSMLIIISFCLFKLLHVVFYAFYVPDAKD